MATKTANRIEPLRWRRPARDVLSTGTQRRYWTSPAGYRVEEHKRSGQPTRYLAIWCEGVSQLFGTAVPTILKSHKSRKAALRTCERHHRQTLRGSRP